MADTRTQIAQRDTTPIEAAHARGLKEGRIQGRARFWWLLDRKNELGARYRNAAGRKRHLEVITDELAEALDEALAEIAYWLPDYLEGGGYFEHPRGSGPDRVTKLGRAALDRLGAWKWAVTCDSKAQSETSSANSADTAPKAG